MSSAWPVPSATTRTWMPVFFSNSGQQVLEQARLLGRGRGGDGDEASPAPGRGKRNSKQRRSKKRSDQTHGSSPLMKAAASAERRLLEETFHRRALDQPPLVEEQHLVAQAPRLAEVVRASSRSWCRRRRRRGSAPRSRASRRDRGWRSARRGTAPRDAAPRRAPARAAAARRPTAPAPDAARGAPGRPPSSASARRASPRSRNAARARARRSTLASAERRSITGRWNTIACRRGRASLPRQASLPPIGASRPCISRISTLLPAPLAPRMMVRGPASIAQRDARR